MTLAYTDAQVAKVVEQIRQNKPPSACCPVCDTTLLLEPVICQLIDRDCDDTELRGVQLDDHWDLIRVAFDCPDCGRGVGHVSLERAPRLISAGLRAYRAIGARPSV